MALNYYVGERVPLYQGLTKAYSEGLKGITEEARKGADIQYRGVKDITDAIEKNRQQQQDAIFKGEQNKIAREKLALDKETFFAGEQTKRDLQTEKLETQQLMQENALSTQTEWKNMDVATQMALKALGVTSQMDLELARQKHQASESGKLRTFQTGEREGAEKFTTKERKDAQKFITSERTATQAWQELSESQKRRFLSSERLAKQWFDSAIAGAGIASTERMSKEDRQLKRDLLGIQLDYNWDALNFQEESADSRLLEKLIYQDSWEKASNKIKTDVFLLSVDQFKEVKRQHDRSNAIAHKRLRLTQTESNRNYSIAKKQIGVSEETARFRLKEFNEYKKPLLDLQKQTEKNRREQFTADRADRAFAEENKNLVGMSKSWNQAIHTEWVRESNQAIANKTKLPTKKEVAQRFFADRKINIENYKEKRAWLNFSNEIARIYPQGGMSNLSKEQVDTLFTDYKKNLVVSETSYGVPLYDGDFADAFNQKIQEQTLDLEERKFAQSTKLAKEQLAESVRQFDVGNETEKDQFAQTIMHNIDKLDLAREESIQRINQSADDLELRKRQIDQQLVDLVGISGLNAEQLTAYEKPVSQGGLGIDSKGKTIKERQLAVQEKQSEKLLSDSKKSLVMTANKIRKDLLKLDTTDTKNLIKVFGDIPAYMKFRDSYLYYGSTPQKLQDEFENKYYYSLSPESQAEQNILRPLDEEKLTFTKEELEIFKGLGRYDEEGIFYDAQSKSSALTMYIKMNTRPPEEMADFPVINAQQLMNDLGLNRLTKELNETEDLIFGSDDIDNTESRGDLEILEEDKTDLDLQAQVSKVLGGSTVEANELFDPKSEIPDEEPYVGPDLSQEIMKYDGTSSILDDFGSDGESPKVGDEDYISYDIEPPIYQLATVQNLTRVAGGADKYISVIKEANSLLGSPDGPLMDLDGKPLSKGMEDALIFGAENSNQIDLSKIKGLKGLNDNYTLDTSQSGISPDLILREINSDRERADTMLPASPSNLKDRKIFFKEAVIGYLLLSNMYEEGSAEQLSAHAEAITYANKFKNPTYESVDSN